MTKAWAEDCVWSFPGLIPKMVKLWREGHDVVYGVRESREGESHFKLLSARLFYRLINRISDVEIPTDTGDFRLIDRRVVDVMLSMPERHRLWRGILQLGWIYADCITVQSLSPICRGYKISIQEDAGAGFRWNHVLFGACN